MENLHERDLVPIERDINLRSTEHTKDTASASSRSVCYLDPGIHKDQKITKRDALTVEKDLAPTSFRVKNINIINSGGCGTVYSANMKGQKVAIKAVIAQKPEAKSEAIDDANKRLKAEGILQQLTRTDDNYEKNDYRSQNPGIVAVREVVEVHGRVYLIQDRWDATLHDVRWGKGRFTTGNIVTQIKKNEIINEADFDQRIKEVKEAFTAIANVIDYMHAVKKTQHLDIKPENIMTRTMADGKTQFALTDFGFATKDLMSDKSWAGSSRYRAPGELKSYSSNV